MTSSLLRTLVGEHVLSVVAEPIAIDGERHPTWCAIYYAEEEHSQLPDRARISLSIEKALRSIFSHDRTWLSAVLFERLSGENFAEAASALGEIRAYGALLDAFGNKVSGVPTEKAATPDFVVRNREDVVYVEVATKRMNDGMVRQAAIEREVAAEKAETVAARAREEGRSSSFSVHGYQVESFGLSDSRKTDDHPVSNAISKLCAVKQAAHQFTRGTPTVLWIDLQDPAFWPHDATPAAPIHSGSPGCFISGSFWYAFYGEKGLPLFYLDSFVRPSTLGAMAHNGKFLGEKGSSLSAVVLSLPHATIVFENPAATSPLPRWFRWFMPDLPVFDVEHSVVNWNQDEALGKQVAAQKARIFALHDEIAKARSTECPW